jgi:predicted nuclease of predicted toxin-antitoxin system
MRIKVDEDLPADVARMLRSQGYGETATVLEQEMSGWKDQALWDSVQSEQRFLVTEDKGVGDIRTHAPGTHCGVLLLRPDLDGIRPLIRLLERTLAAYKLEDLYGTITVVNPRSIRIRRA